MNTLTKQQAKKFVEGYNLAASMWNKSVSDKGKTPFRAYSSAWEGYEVASRNIVARQLKGEINIVVPEISLNEVEVIRKNEIQRLAEIEKRIYG